MTTPIDADRLNDLMRAVQAGKDRDSVVETPDEAEMWDQIAAQIASLTASGQGIDMVAEHAPPNHLAHLYRPESAKAPEARSAPHAAPPAD